MFRMNIKGLIPRHMEERGLLVLRDNLKYIEDILDHRRIPEKGIDEDKIRLLLKFLSLMDTDKDPKAIRVGEREGRWVSRIQEELVSGFCHGIGRSGSLIDPQPKAPGASAMYSLTNSILTSFLRNLGLKVYGVGLPVATGLSLSLCLNALRRMYNSNVAIYPYAAHKSPIKGIYLAGFKMRLVETKLYGDSVQVDVGDIEDAILQEIDIGNNPCVVSTLTFFPPRESDHIEEIAKICEEYNIPHVINGAYALQSRYYIERLRRAFKYRVDAVVSSSDKNLLTPIGGGIVYSKNRDFLREISLSYPGRACATPVVNILVSLLTLGMRGYLKLMEEQRGCRDLLEKLLNDLAEKTGGKVLNITNPISLSITVHSDPVEIAGKLYNLRVTGPRGVRSTDKFATCYLHGYPYNYIVISASLGVKEEDIIAVVEKLENILLDR
ncbi:MAG TPA: O-phosphoseryl-tRNA(Sec) selenium transferase [Methanothermococcus okinawensis]|uniref:O-phosphoseryl-tRNA(Sec) selenium transferase n=1 Tax=Methanothermococcus okinawensis TaxID=155863 RepID=A0A832ZHP5_9EURY|nr:O-phosphoseryl-tRNA(Sec) selenium transferase [Methanothermococcus okinawensis]